MSIGVPALSPYPAPPPRLLTVCDCAEGAQVGCDGASPLQNAHISLHNCAEREPRQFLMEQTASLRAPSQICHDSFQHDCTIVPRESPGSAYGASQSTHISLCTIASKLHHNTPPKSCPSTGNTMAVQAWGRMGKEGPSPSMCTGALEGLNPAPEGATLKAATAGLLHLSLPKSKFPERVYFYTFQEWPPSCLATRFPPYLQTESNTD